jgi:hypothetical protein
MPDESLHQPHDKLFKATFSDPVNAAAFLRHHLGGPLPSLVDWDSLALQSGSFIDPQMAGSEADLLFSTKLAPILPLVLAQDSDRWKTSTRFHELFAFPQSSWAAIRDCTPDFAFRLLELVNLPYEDIRGTPEGILTLRSLRAEPLGELLHSLVWDWGIIAGVDTEAVERFFRYVLNADVDREAFKAKVFAQGSTTLTSTAMTLAEQFRQEGRQEGLQKGRREGRQEVLLEVLEVRFGSVPAGLTETLSTVSDLEKLKALHRAALTCPDLESFALNL